MESQEKQTRSRVMNSFDDTSDENGFREPKRKDDRKKHRDKSSTSSKYKKATSSSSSNSLTVANSLPQQTTGSRYHHHREVPPRFQHNKLPKGQKNTKTSVNKKPMKETSRWQQQSSSSHQHHLSNQASKRSDNDGGWSKGKPEKGSGWNKKSMHHSTSTPDSMDRFSSQGWDSASGDEVKDSVSRSSWLTTDSKVTETDSDIWALSAASPGLSDNDEDNRSQSPGGLVMHGGDRDTKEMVYLPVDDDSTAGVNHWETKTSSSEMMGSIWKSDSTIDESEEEVAKIMTGVYSNAHFPGGRKNSTHNRSYDWGGITDGFTDKSNHESNHDSLNRSENEPHPSTMFSPSDACNGHLNHESTDSQDELGGKSVDVYSLETRSGNETPNRCSSRSSGGGITPTGKQESGGRASVGSTSSANSVSSNSSWNSNGKGGNKGNSNRSNSPRKLSRYDRCNSQSEYSGSGAGNGVGNPAAMYKTRKPKTSIAELEDGLESLQQEPSGWGDLPSPKPTTNVDNGTELWGVPPVDRTRTSGDSEEARKNRCKVWKSNHPMSGSDGIGWGEDPSGTRAAGWGPKESTTTAQINSPMVNQWADGVGTEAWAASIGKPKEKAPFTDAGFSQQMADKSSKPTSDMSTDLMPYSTDEDSEELTNSSTFSLLSGGKTKQPGQAGTIGPGTGTSPFSGSLLGRSQAHMLNQMKIQQQRLPTNQQMGQLHGGGSGGAVPTAPPNIHSYHQQLMQQLGQLQMTKQVTKQQLLKQSGPNMQHLSDKLNQINQAITYINQQLVMLSRIASEQKEATNSQDCTIKPTATTSPKFSRNTPPVRSKMDWKSSGNIERSLSSSVITGMSMGGGDKNITFGVQKLTLGGMPPSNVSQTSARSISRLQQIISGSSSSEDLEALANSEDILSNPSVSVFTPTTPTGVFPGQQSQSLGSPFSQPHSGSIFSHSETNEKFTSSSHAVGTHFSPSAIPTHKSFDDIQEFKPGVPWQPKAQPNDFPQVYSKQNSVPSTTGGYDPPMIPSSTMQSSTRQHQITRSHSVGGGMYYGGGGGFSRSSGGSGRGSYITGNKHGPPHQSWNQRPGHGSSQEQKYHIKSGQRTVSYGGPLTPSHPAPTSSFNQPYSMKTSQGGWKQPKQNRRSIPPSSLPPSGDFQYKPKFHRSAGTPQSTYLTPSTPGSQSDLGTQSWAAYKSVSTSPMMSNTVWGPNSSSKSQDVSKDHQWDNGSNQIWNKSSNTLIEPLDLPSYSNPAPSYSNPAPSSMAYTSSPSKPNTSLAEQHSSKSTTPNSVESFTPGSGPWGQDGFDSAPSGRMLSPEPTFAEWQAGKKARLSAFKLPSGRPSSPWLIVKNISPQIKESALRDACAQYGEVLTYVVNYSSECALICYRTTEEAIMAKTAFDRAPSVCRVSVTAHFLSEADVKAIYESFSKDVATQQDDFSGTSWYSDRASAQTTTNPPREEQSTDIPAFNREKDQDRFLKWGNVASHSNPTFMQQSSLTSTQGNSSLWNDGGFLSGLSSPWHSNFSAPNPSSNVDSMTAAASMPTNTSVSGGSSTMSTFLPNGLL